MEPPVLMLSLVSLATAATTFQVNAPSSRFLADQPVTVTVMNADQIARAHNNADCMMQLDRDGTQTIRCLDGEPYADIEPETFEIPYSELVEGLWVVSATVNRGEPYRLAISGTAHDNCNDAFGQQEGTARAGVNTLRLSIGMTEMACLERLE